MQRSAALMFMAILGGCATSQVIPVAPSHVQAQAQPPAPDGGQSIPKKAICVVENRRVGGDFLDLYRKALESKGYAVTVVPKNPQASVCPLYSRYVANWTWDLVVYLQFAQLDVYRDGQPAGSAVHRAGASRFIDNEATIRQMVDRLLP